MMVQFQRNYRGKLTQEQFYQVGDVVELEDTAAQRLIQQGVAEPEPAPEPEPEPEAPIPPRRSSKRKEDIPDEPA